ncbi:MAG: NAD-binding protein [Pelodictyon phaeoclathratiforme]|nr:NAD-binding protein [Pelodictyon phaeoclathratiforme]
MPCIKIGLYITQYAIPFFAYGTFFTKLFHEHLYPYLKRKTVNSYKGHHVIVSYGAFGKALAKALSDVSKKDNVEPQIVAVDKLHTAEHDNEFTLTILYYDALRADLFKVANLKSAIRLYLMLPDERENLALLEQI